MADTSEPSERVIAPVPRITIQAFCETAETAAAGEAPGPAPPRPQAPRSRPRARTGACRRRT